MENEMKRNDAAQRADHEKQRRAGEQKQKD
jgi:hypothetical protein